MLLHQEFCHFQKIGPDAQAATGPYAAILECVQRIAILRKPDAFRPLPYRAPSGLAPLAEYLANIIGLYTVLPRVH